MARRTKIKSRRTNKRRNAPNTPGGPVDAISVVHDIGDFVIATATFRILKTTGDPTTIGGVELEIIGGTIADLTGWAAIQAGENILESVVADPGTGKFIMTMNQTPSSEVHFVIPPFLPELMSTGGIVCAGGIFQHDYP